MYNMIPEFAVSTTSFWLLCFSLPPVRVPNCVREWDVAASAFRFQQFCSNQFVHQDPNIESTDPVEDWEKGWSPMSFQVAVYGCVCFWTSQVIQFGPNFVACSDTSPVLEQCYRYDRYARRTLQLGFFEAWLNRNLGIPHSKSWELS